MAGREQLQDGGDLVQRPARQSGGGAGLCEGGAAESPPGGWGSQEIGQVGHRSVPVSSQSVSVTFYFAATWRDSTMKSSWRKLSDKSCNDFYVSMFLLCCLLGHQANGW